MSVTDSIGLGESERIFKMLAEPLLDLRSQIDSVNYDYDVDSACACLVHPGLPAQLNPSMHRRSSSLTFFIFLRLGTFLFPTEFPVPGLGVIALDRLSRRATVLPSHRVTVSTGWLIHGREAARRERCREGRDMER